MRKSTKVLVKCKKCGKDFSVKLSVKNSGRGIFCSYKCCYPPKIKIICSMCENEFLKQPCNVKINNYCCRKCYYKARSENQRGENNPNYKGGKIEKKCLNCNKKIKVSLCNQDITKYCSKKCQSIGRMKRIERICYKCGKEFFVIPSLINKGGGKYCSNKCCGNKLRKIKRFCKECNKEFLTKLSLIKMGCGIFCSVTCRNNSMFTGGRKESRKREYEKIKNDSHLRLRIKISILINSRLKRRFLSKNNKSSFDFLPWTIEDLERHLEKQFKPWMNWDNYGFGKDNWVIDHIRPDSSFNYKSVEDNEFQECWALKNLQPLEFIENIKKGNKLNYKTFNEILPNKVS